MPADTSSAPAGALLVVAGVWLLAQTLVGGLVGRIMGTASSSPAPGTVTDAQANAGVGTAGPAPTDSQLQKEGLGLSSTGSLEQIFGPPAGQPSPLSPGSPSVTPGPAPFFTGPLSGYDGVGGGG